MEETKKEPVLLEQLIKEKKLEEEVFSPKNTALPTPSEDLLQKLQGPTEMKSEIEQLTTYFCLKKKNMLQFSSEKKCSFFAKENQTFCLKKYGINKKSILCLKQSLK